MASWRAISKSVRPSPRKPPLRAAATIRATIRGTESEELAKLARQRRVMRRRSKPVEACDPFKRPLPRRGRIGYCANRKGPREDTDGDGARIMALQVRPGHLRLGAP